MNSIIKHLAIATKLLNQPVAEEALASNVARDRNLNANIQSLSEVLRSYGFENHISRRKLLEIPSLAMPAIIILNNEEAAVITDVKVTEKNALTLFARVMLQHMKYLTKISSQSI